ncbi:MAG: PD-(D/E)XK nuclease family protein, partial [Acetobacter sp.]|uniref:PD-(D/E)XK nuclease family protein n=4 Tax=Acetobacter sp. TaxID=440 RepID=UPI0039EA56E2
LAVAERLARTDEEDGPARLWRGEDGNLLAERLGELMLAADILPPQPPVVLDGLLGAVLTQDRAVTRRADPTALHPRVLIWGLFEARLQTAQTVILGGLSEGTWPPVTDAGPWMSRPMRRKVGLPSPELAVGQAAHDFYATVAAAGQVILSCPRRREGAPVVPARWLTRLDAFLAGRGARVPAHPVLAWLRQLDQPPGAANPVAAPRPAPPVALRPRRLSVTEIETWMRDPYAIYARHVLRLEPLAELEEGADASDYGLIVHDALERWVRAHGVAWPDDAEHRLAALFMTCLAERKLRPALRAWWEPRLLRIAQWVAEAETRRRDQNGPPHAILTEARGRVVMPAPAGPFTLVGRADRIDMDAQGGVNVQDYKTGMLPATRDVLAGWSPQLPLEAAMILQGGFEAVPADCSIGALTYWRLTGGADPGQEVSITPREVASLTKLAEQTWQNLLERIAAYDDPTRPYLSHPHPGQEPRFADYARLARVPEWSAARTENDA